MKHGRQGEARDEGPERGGRQGTSGDGAVHWRLEGVMEAGGWRHHTGTQQIFRKSSAGTQREDSRFQYRFTDKLPLTPKSPSSKTRKLGVCPQTHSLALMSQVTIKVHIKLNGKFGPIDWVRLAWSETSGQSARARTY